MQLKQLFVITAILLLINFSVMANKGYTLEVAEGSSIGSAKNPLQISMIPLNKNGKQAIQYVKPLFDAITKEFEIHFELSHGKSYSAVIEAFCQQKVQIVLLGTSSYGELKNKCNNGELLAIEVKKSSSTYYSGIFVHKGSHLNTLKDLQGKSIAFGSQHSTSAFHFPISMLMAAGIHPANDFDKIFITNSHSAAIELLKTGKTMAAAASFDAWQQAVHKGTVDPLYFKPLAKSLPIPNFPFVMNKNLPETLKAKLKNAFRVIHIKMTSDELLNSLGNKLDRYDVKVDEQLYMKTLKRLEIVTEEIKRSVLEKANQSVNMTD